MSRTSAWQHSIPCLPHASRSFSSNSCWNFSFVSPLMKSRAAYWLPTSRQKLRAYGRITFSSRNGISSPPSPYCA